MQNNFQISKQDLQQERDFRETKCKWFENYFWKSREELCQILTGLRYPIA